MGLDLDGGFHLDDPPSPMGEAFEGGLHLEEPPSPITAMVAISSRTETFKLSGVAGGSVTSELGSASVEQFSETMLFKQIRVRIYSGVNLLLQCGCVYKMVP